MNIFRFHSTVVFIDCWNIFNEDETPSRSSSVEQSTAWNFDKIKTRFSRMFSRDLGADHEDAEVTASAPASLPSRPLEDIELSASSGESTESVQLRSGEVVLIIDAESDKSSKSSENDRKLTSEAYQILGSTENEKSEVDRSVVADSMPMHVKFRSTTPSDEAEIKSRISGTNEESGEVKLREEEKSQTSCTVM